MPKRNEFEEYRQPILMAAGELYRAEKLGFEPAKDISRVTVMPVSLSDTASSNLEAARYAEAKVNVAARNIARLALLHDRKDEGGFMGGVAAIEIGITRVMEWAYLRGVEDPAGLVEDVRRIGTHSLPTVE